MATKTSRNRKQGGSSKSASANRRASEPDTPHSANVSSPCPPRSPRWRFADVINVHKLTEQVLTQGQLTKSVEQFDARPLTKSEVFRASQTVRNEIVSRQWLPIWPMRVESETDDPQCPLARRSVEQAVIAMIENVDWQMLARTMPPSVTTNGLRGTHARLSLLTWAIKDMGYSHGVQATLVNGENGGDFSNAISDLATAGLDDDLIYANMAVLHAEQTGRSFVDHAPISEVAEELHRHRVIDSQELPINDVILVRQGAEIFVVGKAHDVVAAEWNRVMQAARGAGMELCPWDDPAETDLNGWERDVAGFGFGVADNEVTISINAGAYDTLESDLEKAACSTNSNLSARNAVEHWLSRQAPGLETQDTADTIEDLTEIIRRTGFAERISDRELSAALNLALQLWIADRDYGHVEPFLNAVNEWAA